MSKPVILIKTGDAAGPLENVAISNSSNACYSLNLIQAIQ